MKKRILIVVMLLFVAAGCTELTPAQMQEWLAHSQELSGKLDTLQEVSIMNVEALNSIGVGNDELLAKVAKVNEEIDRVQPQILAVTDAITNSPLTGDTGQDIIAMVGAANAASAKFNPWAVPIGGLITLVSLVFGFFMKKKAADETEMAIIAEDKAAKSDAKYQAHKTGVTKTIKELFNTDAADVTATRVDSNLYYNIGEARARNGV